MNPNKFQTDIGDNDVLLGRGTGPNEHVGNKIFRHLAAELVKTNFGSNRGPSDDTRIAPQSSTSNCRSSSSANHPTNEEVGPPEEHGIIHRHHHHHHGGRGVFSSISKLDLAKQLVALIHAKQGKFVRKLTSGEISTIRRELMKSTTKNATGGSSKADQRQHKTINKKNLIRKRDLPKTLYVVVPIEMAIEKAKQSFRHQLRLLGEEEEGEQQANSNIFGVDGRRPSKQEDNKANNDEAPIVVSPPRTKNNPPSLLSPHHDTTKKIQRGRAGNEEDGDHGIAMPSTRTTKINDPQLTEEEETRKGPLRKRQHPLKLSASASSTLGRENDESTTAGGSPPQSKKTRKTLLDPSPPKILSEWRAAIKDTIVPLSRSSSSGNTASATTTDQAAAIMSGLRSGGTPARISSGLSGIIADNRRNKATTTGTTMTPPASPVDRLAAYDQELLLLLSSQHRDDVAARRIPLEYYYQQEQGTQNGKSTKGLVFSPGADGGGPLLPPCFHQDGSFLSSSQQHHDRFSSAHHSHPFLQPRRSPLCFSTSTVDARPSSSRQKQEIDAAFHKEQELLAFHHQRLLEEASLISAAAAGFATTTTQQDSLFLPSSARSPVNNATTAAGSSNGIGMSFLLLPALEGRRLLHATTSSTTAPRSLTTTADFQTAVTAEAAAVADSIRREQILSWLLP